MTCPPTDERPMTNVTRAHRADRYQDGRQYEDADDESPPSDEVAQGDDEGEADRVADLGEGNEQRSARRADVEVLGHLVQQGLEVVEVGDDDARRDRHRRDEALAEWVLRRRSCLGGHRLVLRSIRDYRSTSLVASDSVHVRRQ
jgi:hypothetical protein